MLGRAGWRLAVEWNRDVANQSAADHRYQSRGRVWYVFPSATFRVRGNSMSYDIANTGRAVYHPLHTKIDKRLTHGLNFLFAYTRSKRS